MARPPSKWCALSLTYVKRHLRATSPYKKSRRLIPSARATPISRILSSGRPQKGCISERPEVLRHTCNLSLGDTLNASGIPVSSTLESASEHQPAYRSSFDQNRGANRSQLTCGSSIEYHVLRAAAICGPLSFPGDLEERRACAVTSRYDRHLWRGHSSAGIALRRSRRALRPAADTVLNQ